MQKRDCVYWTCLLETSGRWMWVEVWIMCLKLPWVPATPAVCSVQVMLGKIADAKYLSLVPKQSSRGPFLPNEKMVAMTTGRSSYIDLLLLLKHFLFQYSKMHVHKMIVSWVAVSEGFTRSPSWRAGLTRENVGNVGSLMSKLLRCHRDCKSCLRDMTADLRVEKHSM